MEWRFISILWNSIYTPEIEIYTHIILHHLSYHNNLMDWDKDLAIELYMSNDISNQIEREARMEHFTSNATLSFKSTICNIKPSYTVHNLVSDDFLGQMPELHDTSWSQQFSLVVLPLGLKMIALHWIDTIVLEMVSQRAWIINREAYFVFLSCLYQAFGLSH